MQINYLSFRTTILTGGMQQRIKRADFIPLDLLVKGIRYTLNLFGCADQLHIEYHITEYSFGYDSYPFDETMTHLHDWYVWSGLVVEDAHRLLHSMSLLREIHSSLLSLKDPYSWDLLPLKFEVAPLTTDILEKIQKSHKR